MVNYYVSSITGNDLNPGTESLPFLTITHAISVANGGDTINIKFGTYNYGNSLADNVININKELTLIGIKNVSYVRPTINIATISNGNAIVCNASNITLQSLTFVHNPASVGSNDTCINLEPGGEPIYPDSGIMVNENINIIDCKILFTKFGVSSKSKYFSVTNSELVSKVPYNVTARNIAIYSQDGTVDISNNTFSTSTSSTTYNWQSVASSSDGTKLVAVVYGGYIYTSADSGSTWTQRTSDATRNWQSVASSSDGTKLVAVVFNGYIYTSTDSGSTWTQSTSAGSRNWQSVASSSDGTKLVAVVSNGYIYTSTDSGATWTQSTSDATRYWQSVASSSDGTKLVAVVSVGYIYTSTDSGATWTQSTSSGSRGWYSVASSSDGTKLVAVEYYGYIYTSTDSGSTWTQRTSDATRPWQSVASSSDGTKLVAVVWSGYIYTSTDSGSTWTQSTSDATRKWQSVASSSDGTKLVAVVYGGYIYTSADSGVTWTPPIGVYNNFSIELLHNNFATNDGYQNKRNGTVNFTDNITSNFNTTRRAIFFEAGADSGLVGDKYSFNISNNTIRSVSDCMMLLQPSNLNFLNYIDLITLNNNNFINTPVGSNNGLVRVASYVTGGGPINAPVNPPEFLIYSNIRNTTTANYSSNAYDVDNKNVLIFTGFSANSEGLRTGGLSTTEINLILSVKQNQTITFDALPSQPYVLNGEISLSASASSGLQVSYSSSDTSVVEVSGSTLIIKGVGTSNITANQNGNSEYNPAEPVIQPQEIISQNIINQATLLNFLNSEQTIGLIENDISLNYSNRFLIAENGIKILVSEEFINMFVNLD